LGATDQAPTRDSGETPPVSPAATSIRIVAIIPTYNNAASIARVIADVRQYVPDIIAVNDGSTDATAQILGTIGRITLVAFDRNQGKGRALQAGFAQALALGFTHAITIDADGQHLTADIPLFIEKGHAERETLWIGSRSIPVDATLPPPRSRFGRRFGNFWYRFITGTILDDTQCGFRLYPLTMITSLTLKGARYEYEQEALIKAAWSGTPVRQIPIHLYYQEAGERVSHFRTVRDFLRISAVNSRAAFIRCIFPLSTMVVPGATVREKIAHLVKQELRAHATPKKAAFSLALGVFIGIFPIHGFQVLCLLGLTLLLRLNRPLAMLGVCISSPPLLPLIIIAAVEIGRMVLPANLVMLSGHATGTAVLQGATEFVVGSAILSIIAGVVTFLAAYPIFRSIVPRIRNWRRRDDSD
jgi:uncharacterized protein (DUF2062 family)